VLEQTKTLLIKRVDQADFVRDVYARYHRNGRVGLRNESTNPLDFVLIAACYLLAASIVSAIKLRSPIAVAAPVPLPAEGLEESS
jgi:hypothetical protein